MTHALLSHSVELQCRNSDELAIYLYLLYSRDQRFTISGTHTSTGKGTLKWPLKHIKFRRALESHQQQAAKQIDAVGYKEETPVANT